MHRFSHRHESASTHTPSKREKYNNYTPRKRYVKEQEQFSQYHSLTFGQQPLIQHTPEHEHSVSKSRRLQRSRKQDKLQGEERASYLSPKEEPVRDMTPEYNIPEILQDCSSLVNSKPLRQQRLRKNAEDKNYAMKVNKQNQNVNGSNFNRPARGSRILDEEPLTPRKIIKNQENLGQVLIQKMDVLQNKINRLQRMTPKRSATPKTSRRIPDSNTIQYPVVLFEKEPEVKNITVSQVTAVSERESEILSRVSLGRLVEQEEGQSQTEVIQDLSYRISCKLQSIIRNFG